MLNSTMHLRRLTFIILALVFVARIPAQYKSQLPENKVRSPISDHSQEPLLFFLDPERLSISQGIGFTMTSLGGQTFSYGIYSNRLHYLISNKWSIRANLDLMQPTFSTFPGGVNAFTGRAFYGAELQFRPSENVLFQFSVDNYPRFFYHRPLHAFSPFLRNSE